MKENLNQSLKKIKILADRIEQLHQVKRKSDAIAKSKKLFHLATSFAVILLLNENFELFEELLGVALRAWDKLMRLHSNYSFNLNWKKQVLAFELLALVHAQKKKHKTGLKAVYEAQRIVSDLDETVERNLDYIMAVNTLTGFLLLGIEKPQEALEFILIAERIVYKLIENRKKELSRQHKGAPLNAQFSSLEVIGEQGVEEQLMMANTTGREFPKTGKGSQRTGPNQAEEGKHNQSYFNANERNESSASGLDLLELGTKRSCLSPTLLSNYVLGISLLKNIAMKHAFPDNFAANFDLYMQHIRQVEKSLFSLGSVDCVNRGGQQAADQDEKMEQLFNGVAVSFLIRQHKIEILDNERLAFNEVANETFNREFMNMLQVCVFVPLLHLETPKPQNVPKVPALKENAVPQAELIREVLNYRLKIGAIQKAKEEDRKEKQRNHELGLEQEESKIISIDGTFEARHFNVDKSFEMAEGMSLPPDGNFSSTGYPVYAVTDVRSSITQEKKPKRRPGQASNEQQARKPVIQPLRQTTEGVPRLNDIHEFASLVDPRQISQKHKVKLSQERKQSRCGTNSWATPKTNTNPRRGTSLPNNDFSGTGEPDLNKSIEFRDKLVNLQKVVKKQHLSPVPHCEDLRTISTQQEYKTIQVQKSNHVPGSAYETLPVVQAQRSTAHQYAKPLSQTRRVRARASDSAVSNLNDFTLLNLKPTEQIIAEQKAAEERMKMYVRGARQHDENIERILSNPKNDWTCLYSHPKLMGQYYWKDDSIHTNKQRALEIKKVISTSGHAALKLTPLPQPILLRKNVEAPTKPPLKEQTQT